MQANTSRFTKYFEQKYKIDDPYLQNNTIKLTDTCAIYPTHHFYKQQERLGQNYASRESSVMARKPSTPQKIQTGKIVTGEIQK